MPLVPLQQILSKARSDGYAVGYFEAWDACSLEAVLAAAEEESAPVILGFGAMMVDGTWLDGLGVEVLGAIGRSYAVRSAVDGALGSPAEATALGVDHSHASLTDPDEAARFVEETGADCLAVSVGNVHIMMDREASIDMERLQSIHQRVDVPLVIHGGTSFPPAAVAPAIALGVAKFNVGTVLKHAFWDGLESAVRSVGTNPDVHQLLGSHKESDVMRVAQQRMTTKVRSLIRQYGGSGRHVVARELSAR